MTYYFSREFFSVRFKNGPLDKIYDENFADNLKKILIFCITGFFP